MSIQEEIQKAIGAHGMWKIRLRNAISTGKSDQPVAQVCQDNQCAFGQWLYSLEGKTRNSPRWQCVRTAHAQFHQEAARVLELALAGKKAEADAALASTSRFTSVSTALTHEMMMWKKEAA